MKIKLILILLLFFNNYVFAKSKFEKKFEKDLKKISKLNSFVDNQGNHYILDQNIDKDKTIILIYTHGQWSFSKLNGCNKIWGQIPPAIYQLDGTQIKDFTLKTYQLCSGVSDGRTQREKDYFWEVYDKNNQDPKSVLNLKDKNGVLLIDKSKLNTKRKVIKMKIDEFKNEGFKNIVLSGHSAGGWDSLVLKSKFSSDIAGVIAFHPGRSGKFAKEKKPHIGWINWRNYKISLINVEQLENVLVYSHDKDDHENTQTLKFLSNSNFVKFLNVSDTSCKKKIKTGGWHGITLTKCFADEDPRSREIIKYLKQIY